MKRLLMALTAMVIGVVSAYSQRTYEPNFAIGGKAGATLSMMSFSPKVSQDFLPGFMAGVTVRYTEEKFFGLIVELNIEQRGWKEKYPPEYSEFQYSRTLTYLQLPLLTHIRFGSNRVKGFVNLGPEVGVMIGDRVSANFDYGNIGTVAGYPTLHRTNAQLAMAVSNRFDYGISAGAGLEIIARDKHSFMLEGRFYYGLGNIFPAARKDYFSASRGMSIEVTAAYLFRLR